MFNPFHLSVREVLVLKFLIEGASN